MILEHDYEKNELIKRTCRELSGGRLTPPREQSALQSKRRSQKEFINRMQMDISIRTNREKTFEELQDVLAKKLMI